MRNASLFPCLTPRTFTDQVDTGIGRELFILDYLTAERPELVLDISTNIFTSLLLTTHQNIPAQFRTLGKNGPKVSAVGLGLMGLGFQIYGDIPADDERFALLDRAHELGATFWDTAELVLEICIEK